MSPSNLFLTLLCLVILFTGCTETKVVFPTSDSPTPVRISGNNKASVTGKLVSLTDKNQPMSEILVRLAKIFGEKQESFYVLNEADSPGTYTNSEGYFVFEDIDPGNYALLFSDSNGSYRSILLDENKIFTVRLVGNEVTDLGIIEVDLSNPGP